MRNSESNTVSAEMTIVRDAWRVRSGGSEPTCVGQKQEVETKLSLKCVIYHVDKQ